MNEVYLRQLEIPLIQKKSKSGVFDKFAKQALFLPQLKFNEQNKAQEILYHNQFKALRFIHIDRKKNYYLELENDQTNIYRSDRVSKLMVNKSQFEMDNFLDEVLKGSQSGSQKEGIIFTDINLKSSNKKSQKFLNNSMKSGIKESVYYKPNEKQSLRYVESKRKNNTELKKSKLRGSIDYNVSLEDRNLISVKYIGVHDNEIGILSRKTPFSQQRTPDQIVSPFSLLPANLESNYKDQIQTCNDETNKVKKNKRQLKSTRNNNDSLLKLMQEKNLSNGSIKVGDSQNSIGDKYDGNRVGVVPKPYLYDNFLVNKYVLARRLKVNKRRPQIQFKQI